MLCIFDVGVNLGKRGVGENRIELQSRYTSCLGSNGSSRNKNIFQVQIDTRAGTQDRTTRASSNGVDTIGNGRRPIQERTSQEPWARLKLYNAMASDHCLTLQWVLPETLCTHGEHSFLWVMSQTVEDGA